jgi:nitric oxide reductase NorD protein
MHERAEERGAPEPARRLGRFRLLASGIAGRPLEVAPAPSGGAAWTDGGSVFVDATASAADQVTALAVQASLIAAGSLEPVIARRLRGRPAVARRYLAVEGHRALAASEDLLPGPARSLIDRDTAARAGVPAASLALALGREAIAGPPSCFGVIRPERLLRAADRHTAVHHAVTVPGDARDRRSRYRAPREHEEAGGDGPVLEFFANSVGGRGALGWLLQRMMRLGRDPGDGPLGAGASARARRAPGEGSAAVRVTGSAGTLREAIAARRHGLGYPEWDVTRGRYRLDWCTVHEADPRPQASGPADAAWLAAPGSRALRRPLARLGTDLDRCRRQFAGDDIDIDAIVEARVDALAGAPRDQGVYVDTLRRRRDLAVLVLLDISGSAAGPGAGSGPGARGRAGAGGKSVHEQQRAAAAMLTTALHGLGDRVALYAFCSQGRSAVHLMRVKSFDDRLDAVVMRRLGGLVPGAYTRLGAAIRHGAAMLEDRGGASRRLLVVLSDGLAYDHGYERPYGEADSRHALAEARRRGTGCLCLSVGGDADPASLRRVFGTAAHASVAGPEQLAPVIGPLLRAALGSAGRRTA